VEVAELTLLTVYWFASTLMRLVMSPLTYEPVRMLELEGQYVVVVALTLPMNVGLVEIAARIYRRSTGSAQRLTVLLSEPSAHHPIDS
jgi:hypothetical protein